MVLMPYELIDSEFRRFEMSAEQVLDEISRKDIEFIDIQFTDVPGRLQHFTVPAYMLDGSSFMDGIGKVDGSSIRGFLTISESDAVAVPDPSTFSIVPWRERTARLIADIYLGYGAGRLERDPRYVAEGAEKYLREMFGYCSSFWGPEVEYFIFDGASWHYSEGGSHHSVKSTEANWNQEGYRIRYKGGYYPAEPHDTLAEIRSEISRILWEGFHIPIEAHHHEVATAGQCEIDMRFDTLTDMADDVMTLKYVVKNVAVEHGKIATFMPKPIYGDNASGMHVHVSLWEGKTNPAVVLEGARNLFYDEDDEYAELSQLGRYFIGGLLEHSHSLTAIVAPTTSSYRRLVPSYEAPVYLAWSRANRSAVVRVPVYHKGRDSAFKKRVEYRVPDPSANPYLAFAAMLMAGLDGIKKGIDPGSPVDEDIYTMSAGRRRQLGIEQLPTSLLDALESLEGDNEYLRPVFPRSLIETLVEIGKEEYRAIGTRPHPYEFQLYFDI